MLTGGHAENRGRSRIILKHAYEMTTDDICTLLTTLSVAQIV
jgi:hypothetical protein